MREAAGSLGEAAACAEGDGTEGAAHVGDGAAHLLRVRDRVRLRVRVWVRVRVRVRVRIRVRVGVRVWVRVGLKVSGERGSCWDP